VCPAGAEFIAMVSAREHGNPAYAFLQPEGEFAQYFKERLQAEQQAGAAAAAAGGGGGGY
jgi:hypothetical protein